MSVLTVEDKVLLEQCYSERCELKAKIRELKAETRRLQDQANQLSNVSLAKKFGVHPDYMTQLMKTFSVT